MDQPDRGANEVEASADPSSAGFKSSMSIGPGDEKVPVSFILSGGGGGTKPTTTDTTLDVEITNKTKQPLLLVSYDPGPAKSDPPPATLQPGASTTLAFTAEAGRRWTARSGGRSATMAVPVWTTAWNKTPGQPTQVSGKVEPGDGGQTSTQSGKDVSDTQGTARFTLEGGGGPAPETEPGKLTMTIENKSDQPLSLLDNTSERGTVTSTVPTALAPGGSAVVEAAESGDGKGMSGQLVWWVGEAQTVAWTTAWDVEPGKKPDAIGYLNPATEGLETSQTAAAQGETDSVATFTLSGSMPPPPPPEEEFAPPPKSKQPTLRKGDESPDGWVEYAQRLMVKAGIQQAVNGKFDGGMEKLVKDFQKAAKLQIADGIIGNETWSALREGPHEAPSTDGRKPHSFEEKGAQARFTVEKPDSSGYVQSDDQYFIWIVSTGEQKIDDFKATVKVTQKDGTAHTHSFPIGPVTKASPDGQGNFHTLVIPGFLKAFGIPNAAGVAECVLDAYLDKATGGDRFSGPIPVF